MSNVLDSVQISGVVYTLSAQTGGITIDPSLDSGSTNPVANSAITEAIDEISANSVTNCDNVEVVDATPAPPTAIADGYVKVSWEDGFNETYTVDYTGEIGDSNTHTPSNMSKFEFGSSTTEIGYSLLVGGDNCYSDFKTAIFNGNANIGNTDIFGSAFNLEAVYFYAPNPSAITVSYQDFLSYVYDGCETYESTEATYPIYVADLEAYSGAVLYNDVTWSQHFGNRLQEIPKTKKMVLTDVDSRLDEKQDKLSAGTNITISGNVISATGGGGGNPTVELTQAEYDALVTAGTVSADTYYIITDAQAGDLTNYYTKTETDNAITAATSTKQDTLVSGTNIKTINNTSILGSGNIDIQGGGGGGKAIEAGTNISITTGATADTINCTLPMFAGHSNMNSTAIAFNSNTNIGALYHKNGLNSLSYGYYGRAYGQNSFAGGSFVSSENSNEFSVGTYNVSNTGSTTADNTLFSVGNGTENNARHNAFEIRQNGDIYLNNGTSDIKLQDYLQIKVVKITQSDYDQLQTKDPNTLYCIVN